MITEHSGSNTHWIRHGRIPCLDGLRALSIALVLIEHASLGHGFPLSSRSFRLGMLGHTGVSMFFAISGFLITLLLAREWERTGTVSLRGFYRRRALRILPAYFMFLFVVYVLTRVGAASLTGADWVGVLTYTVNFVKEPSWAIGHVWSLSVEEQFYLVWPLAVVLLSPKRAIYVVLAYLVLAPLVRVGIWGFSPANLNVIDEFTPLRLDAMAAGCLLALTVTTTDLLTRVRQTSSGAMAAVAVSTVVIAACVAFGPIVTAFNLTFRYTLEALAMVTIIWSLACWPHSACGRLLETRPFVTVGVLSYSLYLWQQLFLTPHMTHWTAQWPVNLVFAAATAAASYYIVELPFLRIKDRAASVRTRESIPGNEIAKTAAQSI